MEPARVRAAVQLVAAAVAQVVELPVGAVAGPVVVVERLVAVAAVRPAEVARHSTPIRTNRKTWHRRHFQFDTKDSVSF